MLALEKRVRDSMKIASWLLLLFHELRHRGAMTAGFQCVGSTHLVDNPGPSFVQAAGLQLGDAEEDIGTNWVVVWVTSESRPVSASRTLCFRLMLAATLVLEKRSCNASFG